MNATLRSSHFGARPLRGGGRIAGTVDAGARTAAQGGVDRRGALRPLHPRALCHRRLPLSDDAASASSTPRTVEEARAGDRDRARGGRQRSAARRRHLADAGRRSTARSSSTARNISTASSNSTSPRRRCAVEPGIVLDDLNRALKPHGLWFPVDISTASRATIGGMAGNNSCGARSLRYGNTRENVASIDALLADGIEAHFGPVSPDLSDLPPSFAAARHRPRSARDRRARGRRDRRALSERAAPRRRLQSRCLRARPQRTQPRAYSRRLRRHARLLHAHRTEARRRCSAAARSAPAISAASSRRWTRRSTSSSWRPSRSNWSTAP